MSLDSSALEIRWPKPLIIPKIELPDIDLPDPPVATEDIASLHKLISDSFIFLHDKIQEANENHTKQIKLLMRQLLRMEKKGNDDHVMLMLRLNDTYPRRSVKRSAPVQIAQKHAANKTNNSVSIAPKPVSGSKKTDKCGDSNVVEFPLTSEEQINTLTGAALTDNRLLEQLTAMFKGGANNRAESLRSWVDDSLMMQFSVYLYGTKKRFLDDPFFQMLRDAWIDDSFTEEDYKQFLAKNLHEAAKRFQNPPKTSVNQTEMSLSLSAPPTSAAEEVEIILDTLPMEPEDDKPESESNLENLDVEMDELFPDPYAPFPTDSESEDSDDDPLFDSSSHKKKIPREKPRKKSRNKPKTYSFKSFIWPLKTMEQFKTMEERMLYDLTYKEALRKHLTELGVQKLKYLFDREILKHFCKSGRGIRPRTKTTDSPLLMFVAGCWTTNEMSVVDVIERMNAEFTQYHNADRQKKFVAKRKAGMRQNHEQDSGLI